MKPCACKGPHDRRRIVLTGGPGAGKTAVLELVRQSFCAHISYNHQNPLRIESEAEAQAIDERIAQVWASHPRQFLIEATPDFLTKAKRVLELLRAEVPECCRAQAAPAAPNGRATILP